MYINLGCLEHVSRNVLFKFILKYVDTELAVGEMTCVDRCVGKYMMAQQKVGDVLNEFEKQMKAKDAAMAQQQQKFQ